MLTGATYCSGIGAPEQAARELPITWKWSAEIEAFPAAVHDYRFGVPNLGDVTAPDFDDRADAYGHLDLLVAGTPCQAFSWAGLRKSLADERGNLTLGFVNTVNFLDPTTVVWENVPGVLSTKDNAFGAFLGALVGADNPLIPSGRKWPNAGLVAGPKRQAAWRVLDAQYFGLAQRRKRVFVVASTGDGPCPGEVLFDAEGVQRSAPQSREKTESLARGIEVGPSGGCFTDVSPTLDARCKDGIRRNQLAGAVLAMCVNAGGVKRLDAESQTFVVDGDRVRMFTPLEVERLQGFPDGFTQVSYKGKPAKDGPRYKALGNSMAVPVMRWLLTRVVQGFQ